MVNKKEFRNFRYSIEIDEEGLPYIKLPETYEDNTEDKFMIVNLCTLILEYAYESLDLDEIEDYFDENVDEEMQNDLVGLRDAIEYLGGVAFSMGELLKHEMNIGSEINDLVGIVDKSDNNFEGKKYHVRVKNAAERNDLPEINIISGDDIYKRTEGLRVYVETTRKIYELQGGTTNKHWKIVS